MPPPGTDPPTEHTPGPLFLIDRPASNPAAPGCPGLPRAAPGAAITKFIVSLTKSFVIMTKFFVKLRIE